LAHSFEAGAAAGAAPAGAVAGSAGAGSLVEAGAGAAGRFSRLGHGLGGLLRLGLELAELCVGVGDGER
jgi:hypothetical protein